ncbi:hypothetical protein Ancab_039218, partial [Ancistrocladus abbreviatus]
MADFDIPSIMVSRFYPVHPKVLFSFNKVLQDGNSITVVVNEDKKVNIGEYQIEQIFSQPNESTRNDLNSNNIMVKNLKQLEMDNFSFEGLSVSSGDLQRRKKEEDGRQTPKKKK